MKTIWEQRYLLALLLVWSFLVTVSAIWNLHENYRSNYDKALIEAETISQHNLAYRRWNSMHDGVYAKVRGINRPNPYIIRPDRDIIAVDGTRLTMINPFQMTKQAYDLLKHQSPELAVLNRTVSLDPLNPDNNPDPREVKALQGFEDGKGPLSEITTIGGASYMRLMSPYVTEKRCLPCHQHQGYEVGDIRGGMSIAVPMQPYYESAVSARKIIMATHAILWLLGAVTIFLFFVGIRNYKIAIKEKEEKFRIVSEFAYNFEYWISNKKQLAFISPSCERITGYSRNDFERNKHLMFDMIHPDDKKMWETHLVDFEEPAHSDLEYRIIAKDGQTHWLSHTCSPIYVDGQFLGRRGSNRDITDNKRLKEELLQARKIEELGHFAAGVAHDFNNVLASIATFSHLMMDVIREEDSLLYEHINHIIIAAKLGQNMTSNLLMFGRRRSSNLQDCNLNEIIGNIESVIRSLLTKEINCQIALTDAKPPIKADPHQIEQVLINLVTNARDAMPEGGDLFIATQRISLHQGRAGKFRNIPAGNYMLLSVSDTGSGIAEENLTTIFKPFFSTKASHKGTGLGLAILDNIIKQHNGFIDIDTVLQQGTTFQVYLPLQGDGDNGAADRVGSEQEIDQKKKTLLLVDDDWLLRKSLQLFLQKSGKSVLTAADGDEAIRVYKEHKGKIDLVILDVVMPKKKGRQVYDILKQENPQVKALFISGSTEAILKEEKILENGLNFLAKPLDLNAFRLKVEELCNESPCLQRST
jgi:PAS domain S-box-containing protein